MAFTSNSGTSGCKDLICLGKSTTYPEHPSTGQATRFLRRFADGFRRLALGADALRAGLGPGVSLTETHQHLNIDRRLGAYRLVKYLPQDEYGC